jgi:hypothetical protein
MEETIKDSGKSLTGYIKLVYIFSVRTKNVTQGITVCNHIFMFIFIVFGKKHDTKFKESTYFHPQVN